LDAKSKCQYETRALCQKNSHIECDPSVEKTVILNVIRFKCSNNSHVNDTRSRRGVHGGKKEGRKRGRTGKYKIRKEGKEGRAYRTDGRMDGRKEGRKEKEEEEGKDRRKEGSLL
jgi:hypothetical protein